MFRCVILLGGYPSPGTNEVQQKQEAQALLAAVDQVMVVASEADSLSPPRAYAAWLEELRRGAQVIVHQGLTHDRLSTAFVHGVVVRNEDNDQFTLQGILAMLNAT